MAVLLSCRVQEDSIAEEYDGKRELYLLATQDHEVIRKEWKRKRGKTCWEYRLADLGRRGRRTTPTGRD